MHKFVTKGIKNINEFLEVVGTCDGAIILTTKEGDTLNLKSKLTQFVAIANMFGPDGLDEVEISCESSNAAEKIEHYLMH
jgi:glutamine amidotransferase PdxT